MTASTGAISRVTAGRRPTLSVRPQWRRPIPVAGGLLLLGALPWLVLGRRGPARPSGPGMDVRRVPVLYFPDQSPDSSLGYLAAGLPQGLIHQLAEVRSLDVVSRNGVLPYRNVDLPRDSIARALGAGTLVEGTVEPVRDRVRVTVRLVDGYSGADLLRRATFEQPSANLLQIRDSLAGEVARVLRERLGEGVRVRAERSRTRSTEAWTRVQQAEAIRKDGEALVQAGEMGNAVGPVAPDPLTPASGGRGDPTL